MNDIAHADYIAGLAKGLAVLESFDTERQRLNATQAAERAGLTRAAARRHLLTLAHLGYLETDGQFYWLAARVLRPAGAYLASARLPRTIQPTLNRLSSETQDVYSAAVLDGDEVVIIARAAGLNPVTRVLAYGIHVGARLPAHATSTGRVLLAALPDDDLAAWLRGRALARLTPHTTTEPQQLQTLLRQVAAEDCSRQLDEHEIGVTALAVPLRERSGRTVAALNVIVPTARLSARGAESALLGRLRDAAHQLRPLL